MIRCQSVTEISNGKEILNQSVHKCLMSSVRNRTGGRKIGSHSIDESPTKSKYIWQSNRDRNMCPLAQVRRCLIPIRRRSVDVVNEWSCGTVVFELFVWTETAAAQQTEYVPPYIQCNRFDLQTDYLQRRKKYVRHCPFTANPYVRALEYFRLVPQ